MKTRDYIDLARPLTRSGTDYAVAQLLNLTTSAVANYSNGRRVMDNKTALRLSRLLKRSFEELVAAAEMERAADRRHRREWEKLFQQGELERKRTRQGDPRTINPAKLRGQ